MSLRVFCVSFVCLCACVCVCVPVCLRVPVRACVCMCVSVRLSNCVWLIPSGPTSQKEQNALTRRACGVGHPSGGGESRCQEVYPPSPPTVPGVGPGTWCSGGTTRPPGKPPTTAASPSTARAVLISLPIDSIVSTVTHSHTQSHALTHGDEPCSSRNNFMPGWVMMGAGGWHPGCPATSSSAHASGQCSPPPELPPSVRSPRSKNVR